MAWVVNKTTFQVLYNVNTPDYPTEQWLINPDLSTIKHLNPAFLSVGVNDEGDEVLMSMTPDQIDSFPQHVQEAQVAKITELENSYNNTVQSGFTSKALDGVHDRLYASGDIDQVNLIGSCVLTTPINPNDFPSADPLTVLYSSADPLTGQKQYFPHSYVQLREILADGANFKITQLTKLFTLETEVMMCSKVSEVNAINW